MSNRRPAQLFSLGALAAGLTLGVALAADPASPSRAEEAANALKPTKISIDEFNDQVKNKLAGDAKPVRGGTLRVRMPTDPQGLNNYIDNDSPSRTVLTYLTEGLISRDVENFERTPGLARSWEVRDLLELADGSTIDGRFLESTADAVVVAKGSGVYRTGREEVKSYDVAKGTMTLADGRTLTGQIKEYVHTIEIVKAPEETVTIKKSALKVRKEELAGKQVERIGIRTNCVFLFEAREGVLWHDGVPFTIDDALFSMDIIKNPNVDAPHLRNYYKDVEKWEKVGKNGIKFTYARPYFKALSFCGGYAIFPKHLYQVDKYKDDPKGLGEYFNKHASNQAPIGTGPFKFEKWEKGKTLSIVRNDKWWAQSVKATYVDPAQPYLDRIEFVMINNKAASLKELQNGKIDADFDIEQDTWMKDETNSPEFKSKFVRALHLAPMTTYIGWNEERPYFQDKNVRKAMTMLIDRKRILKEVHYDLGLEVTGPNFVYGPANDPTIKPWPYDVKAAKKLLREAGWVDTDDDGILDKDGVKFEFEYLIHNARDYHQKIADIVKESIEQAGIKVNIRKLDWQVFADQVKSHKYDAVRYAVGEPDPAEPDPYQHWHSSQIADKGDNFVSYKNQRVDEIIELGRQEFDEAKRNASYREIHRIVHEDQPWTFLFCFYETFFYSNRCRNVKLYKIGSDPYNLAEWYIPKELQ